MYVTRPLSYYKRNPNTLSTPPEGPNLGYLILHDEESETYLCFGLCKNRYLDELPFPQNKELTTRYDTGGENSSTSFNDVLLIPVLNQPLSSNRYYAIQPHGKHKGEAFTCSREEDKQTCCFCRCVRDLKPRPLDPKNVYQQFEIAPYEGLCLGKGYFFAKSIAPDGFPPQFLRRKSWNMRIKTPKNYQLGEASGINKSLRGVLPDFNFPVSDKNSKSILVGKWYCPLMFIKEGTTALRDQMKRSTFYEMTLERKWEQIFACQNDYSKGNSVTVDVDVESEIIFLDGNKAVRDDSNAAEGVIWFRKFGSNGEEASVGLRVEIVQRMKWELERDGWLAGDENNQVRVHKEEKFEGVGVWREFGCYVLVENFVLKRMDGTLVMSYGFRHTQQMKSKWE